MRRRVVFVVFDGFLLFDLAGPADAFNTVNLLRPDDGYLIEVTAIRAGPVTAQNGLTTVVPTPLADLAGPIDTLVVVGGMTVPERLRDRSLVDGIRRLAGTARRVASVCTGAFLLAEAGLLAGRRATTHWLMADDLAASYPDVDVQVDPIYLRDGEVWTSAGVSAGVDLALALIGEDHGSDLARGVACGLVMYLHRPGGQSQFSLPMRVRAPAAEPLRRLQAYIDANPTDDLSVPALARRAGMSDRHFSRVFTRQIGLSPGRYVERSRAEAARRLLEATSHPLDTVARQSGLGAPETLYRVFRRHWRISPGDFRRRFRSKET